ncbi:MAG: hypothetical protein HQK88_07810 [Nitrospirae bacterium]|nr:hypothetical protein [Nitrospirota bacterium]MBF0533640.1 hypothetical protein [Nitrospirota bacterium]MBF0616709.1 hypothetical protein [Nitrospirota bacterium]
MNRIKILLYIIVLAAIVYMPESALSEMTEPPPPQVRGTVDIDSMIKQVKASPTDQSNMKQRMDTLTLWAQSMMTKGVSVDSVLPQQKGRGLESLSQENPSEACKMIDAIYADVEKFIGGSGDTTKSVSAQSPPPNAPAKDDISNLLIQSKTQSTTAENLNARIAVLSLWAQSMVARGVNIDSVFSKEKSHRLDDLRKSSPADAAALLDTILKELDKFLSSHPEQTTGSVKSPMGNPTSMMLQDEIDKIRKEVKTSQTNSSNVKTRAIALKSWAESLSGKNKYADKIYTIETGLFIMVQQRENPEKAYGLVDKTFADLERAVDPKTDWNAVKAEKHAPQAKKFVPAVLSVNAAEARVSESVPRYATGALVTNFSTAFDSETVRVVNGKINLSVGSVPVIVETSANAGATCTATANGSPFGILDVEERLDRLNSDFYAGKFASDVGYKWMRFLGPPSAQYMIYLRGGMNLQAGEAYLTQLNTLYENAMNRGVSVLVTINPSTGDARPPQKAGVFTQADVSGYSEFLRALIRKLPKVKHFTMETEVDASWKPADYALALATTKKVFNQQCPDCKLYTGGYINPEGTFFEEVFDNLKKLNAKNSFDAFGLWHAFDMFLGVKRGGIDKFELIKTQYKKSRELLNRYGYANMPVFLGETSYPCDTHNPFTKGYSETNQAANLVKTYATVISLGAFRVFWSNIHDYHFYAGGYSIFDFSGLINNPENDGLSSKKLAYYSYKNLAQKLSCFEAAKTSEVNAGPGVTAYRFEKGGKELYIVWANNAD